MWPGARGKGLSFKFSGSKEYLLIGEGFATCQAAHLASGYETWVGFSVSGLEPLIREARAAGWSEQKIILLGDWDGGTFARTGKNPGMLAVQKLVKKYLVGWCAPVQNPLDLTFQENRDFADLWAGGESFSVGPCGLDISSVEYSRAVINAGKSGELDKNIPEHSNLINTAIVPHDSVPERTFSPSFESHSGKAFDPVAPINIPSQSTGFVETKLGKGGAVYYIPKYSDLALYLRQTLHFMANDAFMYQYREEFYQKVSPLQIKSIVTELVRQDTDPKDISKFCEAARAKNFVERRKLIEPPGFINLSNGVLDVRNRELLPHSPEYFFKYKLRHAFDREAKCPRWIEFLERTFEGNQGLVEVSAEIFGYVLVGGKPFLHKAFALLGEGRNGKSTWLDMLKYLLGSSNFSSVPIGKFDKPFSVVMLDAMLANIVGETSTKEIDSESFKTAVGGEELIAAQKGQPEYPLAVKARLIFACNRLPHLGDATTGAHEKFFILPFNRYIPASERDPMFAQKELFPEVQGVLNWALDGLERLVTRGRLPQIQAVEDQHAELREEIDSVFAWRDVRV